MSVVAQDDGQEYREGLHRVGDLDHGKGRAKRVVRLGLVVDPRLTLRAGASLVRTAGEGAVLIVCDQSVPVKRRTEVESWGVEVVGVRSDLSGRPDPLEVARLLASRGVQNVLLEGGATLAGAWWSSGLIDRVMAYVSPRILSGLSLIHISEPTRPY